MVTETLVCSGGGWQAGVVGRMKAIWFAVTLTNALTTLKNAFTKLTAFADALKPSHPTAKWVTGVELLLQDIISLNYLKSLKSASMTSCLWSKFAEFKLCGWRCTLWWWKRRLQSWYAFLHKGLHAWQVQCLTNTFFNVCWWHRLDRVVYNARKRDGTILGGDDGCSSRQESNSNVEVETNRQTLFGVSGSCEACLQL